MATDEYASDRPLSDPVGAWTPPRADSTTANADERVSWAIEQISKARPTVAKWAKMARECDQFAAGEHFSEADRAALHADGRMSAVFNAAQKWLRFISGVEDASQIEMRFVPRDLHSDPQGMAADLASKGVEWVVQNCDGDAERSRAFNDMVRRGMGWTTVRLDRSVDVSGIIQLDRVDGMEMLWDPDAEKENLRDAKWVARERQMPLREALRRWPDHAPAIRAHLSSINDQADRPGTSTLINEQSAVPVEESSWPSVKKNHVKVTEFQWAEEEPGIYFYDPLDDKDEWMAEDEFKKYRAKYQRLAAACRARAADPNVPLSDEQRAAQASLPEDLEHDRVLMNKYRTMLFIGRTELACSDLLGPRFTFNCVTGQWDDKQRIWYPFFKILLDPQRYMTKYANQIMEIISRSSKGGLLIEDGAVENIVQFEQEYGRIGSVQQTNDGAISGGKIKDKPPVMLPQGSVEMFQVCNQLMKEVTGINPESAMGMGSGDVSGVTQQQRQGAGLLLLSMEFRAFRRYRKAESLTIFDFLKVIADNRWFRVGGAYDSQALQLVKEPFFLEYDVILEEGTRDPAVRDAFWLQIKELLPTFMRTGMFVPELLDFMPLPASDRHRFKKIYEQQQKQKQEMAAKGMTDGGRGKPVSQEEVQAKVDSIKAATELNRAKAADLIAKMKGQQNQQIIDGLQQGLQMGQQAAQANQQAQIADRSQQAQMLRDEKKMRLEMERDARKGQIEMAKETVDTSQAILSGTMELEKLRLQNEAAKKKANSVEGSGGR